jgi:hypothetical protein
MTIFYFHLVSLFDIFTVSRGEEKEKDKITYGKERGFQWKYPLLVNFLPGKFT